MLSRLAALLSVLVMTLALPIAVSAGERGHLDWRSGRDSVRHDRRHAEGPKHHHNHGVVSPAGLPSVIPGLGTFAGGFAAVRVKGVGNYIMVSGNRGVDAQPLLAPKARIIDVQGENACSYEAGVCVVRP